MPATPMTNEMTNVPGSGLDFGSLFKDFIGTQVSGGRNTATTQTGTQTGTKTGTTGTTGTSTQTTNADIEALRQVQARQAKGITPEMLSAIFAEGQKKVPSLVGAYANAVGARSTNNDPLALALEGLNADLTNQAATQNTQLLRDAGVTAAQIGELTKSLNTTNSSTGTTTENSTGTSNLTGTETADTQQTTKMDPAMLRNLLKTGAGASVLNSLLGSQGGIPGVLGNISNVLKQFGSGGVSEGQLPADFIDYLTQLSGSSSLGTDLLGDNGLGGLTGPISITDGIGGLDFSNFGDWFGTGGDLGQFFADGGQVKKQSTTSTAQPTDFNGYQALLKAYRESHPYTGTKNLDSYSPQAMVSGWGPDQDSAELAWQDTQYTDWRKTLPDGGARYDALMHAQKDKDKAKWQAIAMAAAGGIGLAGAGFAAGGLGNLGTSGLVKAAGVLNNINKAHQIGNAPNPSIPGTQSIVSDGGGSSGTNGNVQGLDIASLLQGLTGSQMGGMSPLQLMQAMQGPKLDDPSRIQDFQDIIRKQLAQQAQGPNAPLMLADGGRIPKAKDPSDAEGNNDRVLVHASPGEFMLPKDTVDFIGADVLNELIARTHGLKQSMLKAVGLDEEK